jgi:rare lipoprotein A (peptidoglycan hydrolase)
VRGAGLLVLGLIMIGSVSVLALGRSGPARPATPAADASTLLSAPLPALLTATGTAPTLGAVGAPQLGTATFYSRDFQGQTMADGRHFDMNDPTIAASNKWPLGTRLRVRRIVGSPWDKTLSRSEREVYFGRAIVVTVSDHGNFDHALDLSRAAFALIGRTDEGVIRVQIEPLGALAAAP